MLSLLKPQMFKPARVSHLAAVRARAGAKGHIKDSLRKA